MVTLGYIVRYDGALSSSKKKFEDITSAAKAALQLYKKARQQESVVLYESSFTQNGAELVSNVLWANYFHTVEDLLALAGLPSSSRACVVRGGITYTFPQYRQVLLVRDKENTNGEN